MHKIQVNGALLQYALKLPLPKNDFVHNGKIAAQFWPFVYDHVPLVGKQSRAITLSWYIKLKEKNAPNHATFAHNEGPH